MGEVSRGLQVVAADVCSLRSWHLRVRLKETRNDSVNNTLVFHGSVDRRAGSIVVLVIADDSLSGHVVLDGESCTLSHTAASKMIVSAPQPTTASNLPFKPRPLNVRTLERLISKYKAGVCQATWTTRC